MNMNMKKGLIGAIIILITSNGICFSQKKNPLGFLYTLVSTTVFNKNVYKTKAPLSSALTCTVAYKDKNCLHGQTVEPMFKNITFSVQVIGDGRDFVRYKEIKTEGDFAYIRFLKKCRYTTSVTTVASSNSQLSITEGNINKTSDSTSISNSTSTIVPVNSTKTVTTYVISNSGSKEDDNINDYIFMINIKGIDPVKRYLASSNIIGKLVTMPLKYRQKFYDKQYADVQTSINLNYCFGWKFKLGNHPYHSHYINIIPYACGLGAQNYFYLLEGEFDDKNKQKISKPETQIAFTYYCAGLTYEYDRFNIGAFFGWDTMLKPYDNWAYNKKIWSGLGIGYDIFK